MKRIHYDFHIHSCLSPCGDDEATPATIAGFAKLNGLDAAALCDHNTCSNCPAFFEACREYGVIPLAGMELTTAEDIHLICLFPTLEPALEFSTRVEQKLVKIANRTEFFGRQLLRDADDRIAGEYPWLLSNATSLSLEQAFALASECGAACYPAHVDRENNGIIAILGDLPEKPPFVCAEFHRPDNIPAYLARYVRLGEKKLLYGSDAHRLEDIGVRGHFIELPDDGDPAQQIVTFLKERRG